MVLARRAIMRALAMLAITLAGIIGMTTPAGPVDQAAVGLVSDVILSSGEKKDVS